jgi:hypothetical protein
MRFASVIYVIMFNALLMFWSHFMIFGVVIYIISQRNSNYDLLLLHGLFISISVLIVKTKQTDFIIEKNYYMGTL